MKQHVNGQRVQIRWRLLGLAIDGNIDRTEAIGVGGSVS